MTPESYREAAIRAASAHARRFLISPAAFQRCLTGAEVTSERYIRALHHIERRTLVLRTTPYYGKPSPTESLPSTAADPWSFDPANIEHATHRVCICPACTGGLRVRCDTCRGSSRVRCGNCGGSGRVFGRKRMKNCPRCRGSGNVACPSCRGGYVPCATCDRTGRVNAFLTLHREPIAAVRVGGSARAAAVHAGVSEPSSFDAPHTWPCPLVSDERVAPEHAPPELAPSLDLHRDRILATRIQTFESLVAHVELGTLLGTATFELAGREPTIARTQIGPLRARLVTAVVAAVLGGIGALVAMAAYVGRHEWYAREGVGGTVLLAFGAAGLLAALATLGLTLAGRARTVLNAWAPLGAAAVAAMVGSIAFVFPAPSARAAAERLARGDLDGAVLEASACLTSSERPLAEQVLDRAHLEAVRRAPNPRAMDALLAQPWFDPGVRDEATALLASAIRADIDAGFERSNLGELRAIHDLTAVHVPDALTLLEQRLTILELQDCAARESWGCVAERWTLVRDKGAPESAWQPARERAIAGLEALVADRLAAAERASHSAQRLTILRDVETQLAALDALGASTRAVDRSALQHRIARAEADARRDAQRAQREADRRAAQAARAAAAEQRRAERDRQRQEQQRWRAPGCSVRCCDGTCSSCSSSHRGCCSHHGGVC